MTKTFLNLMNSIHPDIRETAYHKQDKHKENYTQIHHNQIAENIYLKKILKAAKDERTFYTQENKDIYVLLIFHQKQWNDIFTMLK